MDREVLDVNRREAIRTAFLLFIVAKAKEWFGSFQSQEPERGSPQKEDEEAEKRRHRCR